MDPFAVVMVGMLLALVVALLLIGRFYPAGDGSEVLDWDPQRKAERDAQNDVDDMDQMLAATNRRRAARGKTPLTEDGLRDQVARDERTMRDAYKRSPGP